MQIFWGTQYYNYAYSLPNDDVIIRIIKLIKLEAYLVFTR